VAAGLRVREIPVKLIYKDATRHFGGALDDPSVRLAHYLSVFVHEMDRVRQPEMAVASQECAYCCD
jgi:dolichol-phosphate mannosyltransferase